MISMALALFRTESDQRINVPIRTNTEILPRADASPPSRGLFITPEPDKRFPARGRAPPVHENMAKPLVTVAESIDLYDGDRREVGLEQVNQSRSRD